MKLNYGNERCDYDNKCCDEHKYAKCCPKNPCPYPILFECANGSGAIVPQVAQVGGSTGTAAINVPVGCITIDTTCLKMPVVKFDFCSLIHITAVNAIDSPVSLTFTLFKQCDDRAPVSCGSWTYVSNDLGAADESSVSFNFCQCECNSCPGCCVYSVVLTQVTNLERPNSMIVMSPVLSIIAKSADRKSVV